MERLAATVLQRVSQHDLRRYLTVCKQYSILTTSSLSPGAVNWAAFSPTNTWYAWPTHNSADTRWAGAVQKLFLLGVPVMIINVRALPSLVVTPPHPSTLANKWKTDSNLRRHRRTCSPSAGRMVLATDSDVDTDTPVLSWKPPWERRRETSGILTGVQYDTGAMDAFFEHRPERASARFVQVRTLYVHHRYSVRRTPLCSNKRRQNHLGHVSYLHAWGVESLCTNSSGNQLMLLPMALSLEHCLRKCLKI